MATTISVVVCIYLSYCLENVGTKMFLINVAIEPCFCFAGLEKFAIEFDRSQTIKH